MTTTTKTENASQFNVMTDPWSNVEDWVEEKHRLLLEADASPMPGRESMTARGAMVELYEAVQREAVEPELAKRVIQHAAEHQSKVEDE